MAEHRRRVDKVLDPAFLADLEIRSLDELRLNQAECLEIETEVSYVRRLAQARIDILEAELDRRAVGGSVGDLIAALPEILADEGRRAPAGKSRMTRHLAPQTRIRWKRGLEHLVADGTPAELPALGEDDLRSTIGRLRQLEQQVSQQRRAVHQVIDRVDAALTARHKLGHA